MSKRMTTTMLMLSVLALLSIGIVMVYSTSSISALKWYNDQYYFLKKQLLFAAMGILLLIAAARFPYQYLAKLDYVILVGGFVLLVLVLIPGIGVSLGGATRWLRIGPLSVQPSEGVKLGLIVFLSSYLYKRQENVQQLGTGFLIPLAVAGTLCLLVLGQPDFGSACVIMALTIILLFVSGARLLYMMSAVVPLIPAACYLVVKSPYRLKRFTAFLDPWSDPAHSGFQIIQSFLAFGSGGVWGSGLGSGRQKLFYLPEAHTDFILSVVGEELGLLGVISVVVLFFVVIYCGLRIASRSGSLLGTYMAVGVVALIGVQALINMGVVMGLLPTKGSTLPFISYGGTSLLVSLVGVGILVNISSQSPTSEA
jgi:cell division protein FtsW